MDMSLLSSLAYAMFLPTLPAKTIPQTYEDYMFKGFWRVKAEGDMGELIPASMKIALFDKQEKNNKVKIAYV